jgi:hypothetical protein
MFFLQIKQIDILIEANAPSSTSPLKKRSYDDRGRRGVLLQLLLQGARGGQVLLQLVL